MSMKRLSFLKTSLLGCSSLLALPLLGCNESEDKVLDLTNFTLNELSVLNLQQMMEQGELSSLEITSLYLKRINETNTTLKAVIEINPDAENIAMLLDAERKEGKVRSSLHGIPILIKDNIDSGDKMMTTAGSLALQGFRAKNDAFIVQKLRDAGAVLIGKTNLSEWANIRSTSSSSGWSGRGGQVRNPYVLDRTPCGSSSGTGVAVAANLCAIGIGTETDGSIVCPSGTNGIVGIKPTLGSWSRRGIIPISHSQDTAGPMARTVTDAAILLGALSAEDPNDRTTCVKDRLNVKDYTKYLKLDGLRGKRIGVARQFFGFNSKVDSLLEQSLETINKKGAELVDVELKGSDEWGAYEWQVLLYELKADLNTYFEEHPNTPMKSLADVIKFNKNNADKEMPWFNQEIFEMAQAKGGLNETEYIEALKQSKQLSREAIDSIMNKENLDAIVAPTNGPAWSIDWVNGDHFGGGSSAPAAISGYPNITVPAGFVNELPVGLSFFGKAWSEPKLIELAYAYEQATKHRKTPKFIPSLLG